MRMVSCARQSAQAQADDSSTFMTVQQMNVVFLDVIYSYHLCTNVSSSFCQNRNVSCSIEHMSEGGLYKIS